MEELKTVFFIFATFFGLFGGMSIIVIATAREESCYSCACYKKFTRRWGFQTLFISLAMIFAVVGALLPG